MVCSWCKWRLKHCSSLKIVQLPIIWHWFSVHVLQLLNTFLARKLEILAYDIKICNWTWVWKHFSKSSVCSILGSSSLVLYENVSFEPSAGVMCTTAPSASFFWSHFWTTGESVACCGSTHLWICPPSLWINYHIMQFGILHDSWLTNCKIFAILKISNPQFYHSVQSLHTYT